MIKNNNNKMSEAIRPTSLTTTRSSRFNVLRNNVLIGARCSQKFIARARQWKTKKRAKPNIEILNSFLDSEI